MATEGKVHGASVWKSIKQSLSFSVPPKPVLTAQQSTNISKTGQTDTKPRLDVHARSATTSFTERPPTTSSSSSFEECVAANAAPQPPATPSFGYSRSLEKRFRVERELARGGNGIVYLVTEITTDKEWAMKSLPKVLNDPNLSERKRQDHVNAIKREVDIMRRLKGCLNVASLEDVYETDTHVNIVMELCRGGELIHRIGAAHYSERTVASFMRATLRTLAQCHANKILHRDIKPGNFLLSSDDVRAPLKAVDFGLAVFYDDEQLPRTDLGLEGTPWFMAPETLRSEVFPASDVWAAGVMAHQLLTGRFPFNDASNANSPSLSKVWKSILTDSVDFKRNHWVGISDEGKDFVNALLNKDPKARPTAKEALKHPWLAGKIEERSAGRPLSLAVVQRIQRYSQASLFKRTILEMIAEELLAEQQRDDVHQEQHNGDGDENSTPAAAPVCELSEDARPVISHPSASPLEYLYERLRLVESSRIDRAALAEGFCELGYKLSQEEVDNLLNQLDPGYTGHIGKSQLAASQIDWRSVQENRTEQWLRCARRAFADLDTDQDGLVSTEDMVALLRHKLPPAEVEMAVRQALVEAARRREESDSSSHGGGGGGSASPGGGSSAHGGGGAVISTKTTAAAATASISIPVGNNEASLRNGLNFRQFMRMLHSGSADSLDMYDDRRGSMGSLDRLALSHGGGGDGSVGGGSTPSQSIERVNLLLNRSIKGGEVYSRAAHLDPVPEQINEA